MQVLVIGGTRFIGVHVVAELIAHGHTPVLFNRGQSQPPPGVPPLPPGIRRITGDRRELDADTAAALRALKPDAVVDMGVVTANRNRPGWR